MISCWWSGYGLVWINYAAMLHFGLAWISILSHSVSDGWRLLRFGFEMRSNVGALHEWMSGALGLECIGFNWCNFFLIAGIYDMDVKLWCKRGCERICKPWMPHISPMDGCKAIFRLCLRISVFRSCGFMVK